jgi:CDP-diglyceride synthetase
MKNNFLVIGGLLVLINTATGLVFSSYDQFNLIFTDFSIILTTLSIWLAYKIQMSDGFKIGFTLLFAITGLLRFIFALLSPDQIKDNFLFLLFIILVAVEAFCLFVGNSLKNK